MRRIALLGLVVLVTGCTAHWNALVRYSAEPAAPDESPEVGVYAAVLDGATQLAVLTDSSAAVGRLDAIVSGGGGALVPGHWADTLKREVRAALADGGLAHPADSGRVRVAARLAGVALVPPWTMIRVGDQVRPVGRLWLSRPGFNRDSTVAAIRLTSWCGRRCGSGGIMLLARRPGYRWRIWRYEPFWVS